MNEIFKVIQIDFLKAEKIILRQWSTGDILNVLDLDLENLAQEIMMVSHFSTFFRVKGGKMAR